MIATTTYGDDADLWGWEEQDLAEDLQALSDGITPKTRLRGTPASRRAAHRMREFLEASRKSCPKGEPYGAGRHEAHCRRCGECLVAEVSPCYTCMVEGRA